MANRSHTPPLCDMNFIPSFNPKTSVRSLDEWFEIVLSAREVWKCSESQTVQRAGAVLGGEAAKWYLDWLHPKPSWSDFVNSLSRRCKAQFSYMDKFKKAISFSSVQENTYFEYCVEKNRLLNSVFKVDNEEHRVAIIIDGINARFTKNHLTGLMIKSVDVLYNIVSRFEDRKQEMISDKIVKKSM